MILPELKRKCQGTHGVLYIVVLVLVDFGIQHHYATVISCANLVEKYSTDHFRRSQLAHRRWVVRVKSSRGLKDIYRHFHYTHPVHESDKVSCHMTGGISRQRVAVHRPARGVKLRFRITQYYLTNRCDRSLTETLKHLNYSPASLAADSYS